MLRSWLENIFSMTSSSFSDITLSRSCQKAKMKCSKSDISMYGEYKRMLVICTYSHSNEQTYYLILSNLTLSPSPSL
jgi:hypothetical protein